MWLFTAVEETCAFIWGYPNFQQIVEQLEKFFDEHLAEKFQTNYPQLIHSAKWKFDYIVARKKRNE